jgi:hypothetical protein
VTWPRGLCEWAAERLAHQLTLRKDSYVKRGHTQLSAARFNNIASQPSKSGATTRKFPRVCF